MIITTSDIAGITKSRLIGLPDIAVTDITIDSRHVSSGEGLLFVAIKGKNHDGHQYIGNLYRRGVKAFIVEQVPSSHDEYGGAAFILSGDSVVALQELATFRRDKFRSPVIAVTGSTGKTVVKEWLAGILGLAMPVVRSPKSYNSQVGVPLSVWKLEDKYKMGVFEAGISQPGEMERLRKIIKPVIGVITNIGDAHSENFPDNITKAREKLKLFTVAGTIIYYRDQKIIHQLILGDEVLRSKTLIDWSFTDRKASVYVTRRSSTASLTTVNVTYKERSVDFEIPFTDRASVENAITVVAVCLALRIPEEVVSKGLSQLVAVAMRMEMKNGVNNCQLIEDYYNSDPGSLGMALEYLGLQNKKKTFLILSDFMQSGREEKELYSEVAGVIRKSDINTFIGIGESLSRNAGLFGDNSRFFRSTDEFIDSFNSNDFRDGIILLKGARVFEFERIGMMLEEQVHQTVLEVNLDAISHNLNQFRRYLDPGTQIMAMVKAFAYGTGASEIASFLEYQRVSYLAVAYTDEGVELRKADVSLPIMVMNPDMSACEILINYNLEPEIYSISSLEKFIKVASRHGLLNYPVHLKIDTGMHRLGFLPDDLQSLVEIIRSQVCLKVISLFSHLAASDNPVLDDFTHRQVDIFLKVAEKIREATGYDFVRHILNSSGIARMPQYQFEMVRLGIGMYGIGRYEGLSLETTGRFKTRVSQVKRISAGEPVGYGCSDVTDTERTIAVLPVGYADGLNRKLGNRNGDILIRGLRVPVIGNICMDMCMVDVTGLDVVEGDEAEIFGENITIEEVAARCQTIPYEILSSIPGRVKRVFFRES